MVDLGGLEQALAAFPAVPLLQPTQVFVATTDLKNAVYNATYNIDVTKVSPK